MSELTANQFIKAGIVLILGVVIWGAVRLYNYIRPRTTLLQGPPSLAVKRVLLFVAFGPGVGALPFVLVMFIAGFVDRTAPAFGVLTLILSYPVGILPAALAGVIYNAALRKWGASQNRLLLGALAGFLGTGLVVAPLALNDIFAGKLHLNQGMWGGYFVIGLYAGSACALLSGRFIENRSCLNGITKA